MIFNLLFNFIFILFYYKFKNYVNQVKIHKIIMVIGGYKLHQPQQQYHIPSDRITNHILGDGLLLQYN